jgi:copper(I)-binding protein
MHFRSLLTLAAALVATAGAFSHEYQLGNVRIDHPYARPTAPGQTSGAAYLTIENRGKTADKLVGVASPAAKAVEIHTMSMQNNVMKMREVQEVVVGPASTVAMQPGDGYHLMLIGLTQPLKAGDKLPLKLTFEKAGATEVAILVQGKDANAGKKAETTQETGGHQHH